jgi:uncharacterized protein
MEGLPDRVRLCDDLLRFERDGRVMLVSGTEMRPLVINRGSEYVEELLAGIEIDGAVDSLVHGEDDATLVRSLLEHRIVLCAEEQPRPSQTCKPDPAAPPQGMSLYLLLAQNCNQACVYCLNGEETYHRGNKLKMTEEVAFKAVEVCLDRIAPGGSLEIVFFGGEPLLNWDLAKKVITHCEDDLKSRYPDKSWRFHLTSNLTVMPPDLIEWITRHKIGVLCDVDGPPELHNKTRPFRNGKGSFAKTAKHVAALREAGIEVGLRATVTSHNVDRMVEIARTHKELGGNGSAYVPVNAVTSDEDILGESLLPDPARYARGLAELAESGVWELEQLFPFNQFLGSVVPGMRQSHACGAIWGNTPVVDVNGDIYACIYLVGLPEYRTGNVFAGDGFPNMGIVNRLLDVLDVDHIEDCAACPYRYVCASGCPVGRLSIMGNPGASESVKEYTQQVKCLAVRVMVETILWRCAERAHEELQASTSEQAAVC